MACDVGQTGAHRKLAKLEGDASAGRTTAQHRTPTSVAGGTLLGASVPALHVLCDVGQVGGPEEAGPDLAGQHVLKVSMAVHYLMLGACRSRGG